MTTDTQFSFVLKSLESNKGQLKEVAKKTGVPYSTISKITQGTTKNPGVLCVEALWLYFSKKAV